VALENIIPCGNFNIKSSTEIRKNCILGKITMNVYLLDTSRNVGEAQNVHFLVADNSVNLGSIILGTNFCKQANVDINFSNEKSNVTAHLKNKQNKSQSMNLMMKVENCHFSRVDENNFQSNAFLCKNYLGKLLSPDKTEDLGNVQRKYKFSFSNSWRYKWVHFS
jgi:hypothetical protein